MRNTLRRVGLLLCASALLAAPAYANVPKEAEVDTEPAEIIETTPAPTPTPDITYEPMPETTSQPFTIAGNGEVMDDIADGSKEFYTITTSNNNSFFIVVDKARASENVYMLAKVNEDDVAEFIEGWTEPTPTPAPTVQIQLPTPAPTPQVITTEPVKEEKSINSYALIGALALVVIGGGWYFKVYKPKHEDFEDEDEGMEFDDSDDDDEE